MTKPIQQKNGRWKATVDLGAVAGRRRRAVRVFDTETQADAWIARQKRDPEAGRRRSVLEVVDEYLDAHGRALAPNTENNYRARRNAYVADTAFGGLTLDRLTTRDLEAFYVDLQAGTYKPHGTPLAVSTVRNVHRVISNALKYAKKRGYVEANVAREAEVIGGRTRRRAFDDYDLEDIARVLDAAPPGADLEDVVRLALATGARIGELCAVRWRDVDLEAGTVRFAGSASRKRGGTKGVERKGTKTDVPRRVRLDPETVAMLEARRRRQARASLEAGAGKLEPRAVFSRELEVDLTNPRNLAARWNYARRVAGVAGLRFHDLRHVACSEMMRQGVSVPEAAHRSGHDSKKVFFDTYGHRAVNDDAAAVAASGKTWQAIRGTG